MGLVQQNAGKGAHEEVTVRSGVNRFSSFSSFLCAGLQTISPLHYVRRRPLARVLRHSATPHHSPLACPWLPNFTSLACHLPLHRLCGASARVTAGTPLPSPPSPPGYPPTFVCVGVFVSLLPTLRVSLRPLGSFNAKVLRGGRFEVTACYSILTAQRLQRVHSASGTTVLVGRCDSHWAGDSATSRSITSFHCNLRGSMLCD